MKTLSCSRLSFIALAVALCNGCNRSSNVNTTSSPSVPLDKTTFTQVAGKTIYFGHQSVGNDILDGVSALARDNDALAGIKVTQLEKTDQVSGPGIYHSRIGKNRDTASKLAAFEEVVVRNGVGDRVDVAMMKFCYVDITPETDVKKLFEAYETTMNKIQQRYPRLVLVHCTVPLTVHGGGLRRTLRNWVKGDTVNIQRARYNQMVRDRFGKSGHVFDIAAAESTLSNGKRVTFGHKGRHIESAAPRYTDGVGHLNAVGGKHVASRFLAAVAGAHPPAVL
jgi:hypothetical protein